MAIHAVIDLGTNTFRLLIAEVTKSSVKPIYSENKITRLGEGFSKEKRFLPSAMERAMDTLTSFKTTLNSYVPDRLSVIGTSAFRESENRDAFLLSIKKQVAFEVDVISGKEEARLTFLGANLILKNHARPMLLIDIGGGSTEFIVSEGETPHLFLTTNLGVVRLTEQYLHSDPSTGEECEALKLEIERVLRDLTPTFPQTTATPLFAGTAGTLTTLAAIDQKMGIYDPEKVNGYPLSKKALQAIFNQLFALPLKKRCHVPGLEKGREDLIIPGLLILLVLMDLCHYDPVVVSDYGLREGVLIDRYNKKDAIQNVE